MASEIKVELVEQMGDDLAIVNAARVSYAKESALEGPTLSQPLPHLKDADRGLIGYLMKNRHGTPFEMVVFKYRVHVPIGVAREWQRHRIGSFNEVSTRYVEMQPDFYVPPPEAIRRQVGKAGHYTFEVIERRVLDAEEGRVEDIPGATVDLMRKTYEGCYWAYQELLKMGVAKELARNVLPLALFTEFIWTVNLRSLLNFLSLRTAPNALLEIRVAAEQVEKYARSYVPVAMAAWDEHGRLAP